MSSTNRQSRFLIGDDDPFADTPSQQGDAWFEQAIPPHVVASHPNRWVVLRRTAEGQVVVRDADDLNQLLEGFELSEGDVTAFVRHPSTQYA